MAVEITFNRDAARPEIAIRGSFTFAAHSAFRDIIEGAIGPMPMGSTVTFDLRGVEFVDSAALGMLLLAREAAARRSGQVVLRGATGQVQRMLDISKFDKLFRIESC